jgi:hypothetical protein
MVGIVSEDGADGSRITGGCRGVALGGVGRHGSVGRGRVVGREMGADAFVSDRGVHVNVLLLIEESLHSCRHSLCIPVGVPYFKFES